MTVYAHSSHQWRREEVAKGVWLSLGLQREGKVTEVTPRKFFGFKLTRRPTANGKAREFHLTEQITFDKLVVSDTPAGPPKDILHNGHPQVAGPSFPVLVTPYWNEFG